MMTLRCDVWYNCVCFKLGVIDMLVCTLLSLFCIVYEVLLFVTAMEIVMIILRSHMLSEVGHEV